MPNIDEGRIDNPDAAIPSIFTSSSGGGVLPSNTVLILVRGFASSDAYAMTRFADLVTAGPSSDAYATSPSADAISAVSSSDTVSDSGGSD